MRGAHTRKRRSLLAKSLSEAMSAIVGFDPYAAGKTRSNAYGMHHLSSRADDLREIQAPGKHQSDLERA